jgi:DNA-binding CsgD family transcriptional regulator
MLQENAVLPGISTERRLTPRQLQVIELLANGLNLAEAAYRLGIARCTAKQHVENARERMGGLTRQQLILRLALEGAICVTA